MNTLIENPEIVQTEHIPCATCGNLTHKFHAEGFYGLCGSCYSERREKENAEDKGSIDGKNTESMNLRMDKWSELCPELYRHSDTTFIDQGNFVKVTKWKIGQKGLMISGRSRLGKTTSVWHLLHKLYVLEGHSFKAISEPEFCIERDKHSRNGTLDSFLNACIFSDVFFLDDVGHAATNSRNMEELYHVIAKRTDWKKPVIVTTQFTRDELELRASGTGSKKTAVAILNRLASFCYQVAF
jgi:DNA replication protein DnaC